MSMNEVMKPKEEPKMAEKKEEPKMAEKKEEPKMAEKKEAPKMAEKKGSKVTKTQIKDWAVKVAKSEPVKPKPKVKLIIKPTTKSKYSKEEIEEAAQMQKARDVADKAKLKNLMEVELPRHLALVKSYLDKKQITEKEAKESIKQWKKAHGLK